MKRSIMILCVLAMAGLCSCAAHYEAKTRLHEARRDVIIQEAALRSIEASTPLSEVEMADGTTFRTYRQAAGHVGEVREASSIASGIAEVANTTAAKIITGGIAGAMILKQSSGDVNTGGGDNIAHSGNTNSLVNGEDGTYLDQGNRPTDNTSTPVIVRPEIVKTEEK